MSGPIDISDEVAVRDRGAQLRARQRSNDAALAALMDVPQMRAWMFELLSKCHVFNTSFSTRALEMAFNEGERNIGLFLQAEIMRVAPQTYLTMLKEQQDGNRRSDEPSA